MKLQILLTILFSIYTSGALAEIEVMAESGISEANPIGYQVIIDNTNDSTRFNLRLIRNNTFSREARVMSNGRDTSLLYDGPVQRSFMFSTDGAILLEYRVDAEQATALLDHSTFSLVVEFLSLDQPQALGAQLNFTDADFPEASNVTGISGKQVILNHNLINNHIICGELFK